MMYEPPRVCPRRACARAGGHFEICGFLQAEVLQRRPAGESDLWRPLRQDAASRWVSSAAAAFFATRHSESSAVSSLAATARPSHSTPSAASSGPSRCPRGSLQAPPEVRPTSLAGSARVAPKGGPQNLWRRWREGEAWRQPSGPSGLRRGLELALQAGEGKLGGNLNKEPISVDSLQSF